MKSDMKLQLASCPFCGNEESVRVMESEEMADLYCDGLIDDIRDEIPRFPEKFEGYLVICDASTGGCGASSGWGRVPIDATAKWNRRA